MFTHRNLYFWIILNSGFMSTRILRVVTCLIKQYMHALSGFTFFFQMVIQ